MIKMYNFLLLGLVTFLGLLPSGQGQCLPHDAVPPKCVDWVRPDTGTTVFFEHQFNCSRFWVCEPDLSDCLHECPANLFFDIDLETCNYPNVVDCTNKPADCGQCQPWQECRPCSECPTCEGCTDENDWYCTPDCKLDVHCDGDEYCDFNEGGDGNCQKGCRGGEQCQVDNSVACGVCTNHVCDEPECCTNQDCQNGICENGVCQGCGSDADCMNTICSTCDSNHVCQDPECCIDEDCEDNEYCDTDAGSCKLGCRDNSDCTDMTCSTCDNHQCVNPECCSDADCLDSQFCENNQCKDGCNEDSDCSKFGDCATCGADHQCTEPECCKASDCNSNLSCAVCQADFTCTDPECCSDSDCVDPSKPICDTDNQMCVAGCRTDSDCPLYDGICNGKYDENSSCQYCSSTDGSVGSCEPGCVGNQNCDSSQPVCSGTHHCQNPGSDILQRIYFTTEACEGCSNVASNEGGPKIKLTGKPGPSGATTCTTNGLDHEDIMDFRAGQEAAFEGEEDRTPLGSCYMADLLSEVRSGQITWTGEGQWTVKDKKISFQMSNPNSCPYECTLKSTTLRPGATEDFASCDYVCP